MYDEVNYKSLHLKFETIWNIKLHIMKKLFNLTYLCLCAIFKVKYHKTIVYIIINRKLKDILMFIFNYMYVKEQ